MASVNLERYLVETRRHMDYRISCRVLVKK
jgi:hypothetical protein